MHLLKESTLIEMAALQYANFMDSVNSCENLKEEAEKIVREAKLEAENAIAGREITNEVDGLMNLISSD